MEYICKKNIYSYLLAFLITLCFITIATPSYAFDLDSLLGDEEVDPSFKDLLGEDELPMIGDSDVKREKAASKLDQKDKKNIPVVRKENKEEPNAEAKVEAKPVAKKTAVVEEKKPEEKAAVDKDKGFIPKVLDDLNIFSSDGKDTQKEEKTVKKEVKTEDAGGVVPGLLESLGGGDDLSSAVNQKNEDDLTDVDLGAIEPVEPQAGEKQISAAPKSRIQKLSAGGATVGRQRKLNLLLQKMILCFQIVWKVLVVMMAVLVMLCHCHKEKVARLQFLAWVLKQHLHQI